MAWFRRRKKRRPGDLPSEAALVDPAQSPDWIRCAGCGEILPVGELKETHHGVCPQCGFHFAQSADEQATLLLDADSFTPTDIDVQTVDLLGYKGAKKYKDQLKAARKQTARTESIITGIGHVEGRKVAFAQLDVTFLDGTLGGAASERLCLLLDRAAQDRLPVVTVVAGGGTRHQEGPLALAQLARISEHRVVLAAEGIPYLSVLAPPSPRGPCLTFALSGDVNIALAADGAPRPGSAAKDWAHQLHKSGLVDMVVPRGALRELLSRLIRLLAR